MSRQFDEKLKELDITLSEEQQEQFYRYYELLVEWNKVMNLTAIQKLNKMKPRSIGQASRISGVSPADISVLLVYMEQFRRKKM